jgi:hypothetical protein
LSCAFSCSGKSLIRRSRYAGAFSSWNTNFP